MNLTAYSLPVGWTPIGAVSAYNLAEVATDPKSPLPLPHLVICRRMDRAALLERALDQLPPGTVPSKPPSEESCESYRDRRDRWLSGGWPAEDFPPPPTGCN